VKDEATRTTTCLRIFLTESEASVSHRRRRRRRRCPGGRNIHCHFSASIRSMGNS